MATPQAVTAVIRASRPDFKSTADKAAFAVHAVLSVNGFSLRKVGEGVDEAIAQGPSALPAEEADLAGWNLDAAEGDGGTYSFLYALESGPQQQQQAPQPQPPLLLVKCIRLSVAEADPAAAAAAAAQAAATGGGDGDAPQRQQQLSGGGGGGGVLLVSLADVASGRPPVSLEVQLDRYVPSLAPGASGYEHLDELVRRVEGALAEALEASKGQAAARAGASSTAATTTAAAARTSARSGSDGCGSNSRGEAERELEARELERLRQLRQQQQEEEERQRQRDPLRDDRYLPARGPPGGRPRGVGDEDLMPGGLRVPPGLGGMAGPGGVPLGPRGMGGGMHVGPENPIFADRLRHPHGPGPGYPPGLGGGGGGVPGMRWDPISPEGLEGWSPDDFTRAGRAQRGEGFNDIGRPPPGRGPDWDNMFG